MTKKPAALFLAGAMLLPPLPASAELPPPLAAAVASSESSAPAELLPRQYFLDSPKLALARLSPDERRVAFVTRSGRELALHQLELASGEQVERLRSRDLQSLDWSSDSHTLFLQTSYGLAALETAGGRAHLLVKLEADKQQFSLGTDPAVPAAALVSLPDTGGGHNLYRIGTSGERTALLHTETPVRDLLTDAGGVRYMRLARGDHQEILQIQQGGEKRKVLQCDLLDACALLGFHNNKLVLRSDGGGQYRRLLQLDTASGQLTELHRDPLGIASLDSVSMARNGIAPLIASYRSELRHNYGLGAAADRVRSLQARLHGLDLDIDAHSANGNWLVRATRSDYHRPRYFLLPAGSDNPRPLLEEFSADDPARESQLSEKIPFTFNASDGLSIPAYVTLPRGRNLHHAPIIALPHGGPWNRVDSTPNRFTQFLANRGYIVFEPNFRASTGYSRDFALAGKGEFGRGRVQQDILDGLDYLLANGIGDAHKQAIVGHSFGGFAALTGLAFTPDRFVAGVASSPPVDLISSFRDYSEHFELRNNGLRWTDSLDQLAGDLDDPQVVKTMRDRMPATHVDAIKKPLLVIAGGVDPRVDQRRVKGFVTQLQANDNAVALLLDPHEGHNFRAPLAREAYYYLVETFLSRYLGGRRQDDNPQTLQRYLKRNLLLDSDGLTPAAPPPATAL
ncbi:alpha/beta fold hydrolase [Microbulbifer sp. SAOS-129_SWC]|uniref:S9 family peptidase n=1 Tax=Microbulbifer sp. SAOS-129_SWC TaxID=3145235 RepID=UPI0032163999